MRRFFQLCGILVLASVLFAISAVGIPHMMPVYVPPTAVPPPVATPVINVNDGPDHATIEYGSPEVIKHNNDPFHVYIRYPQAGNPTDDLILDWAQTLYNDSLYEFNTIKNDHPRAVGEVNVHFDSFLIDNRYAGIFESGDFSYAFTEERLPAEEIIKTFNIDLSRNVFLDPTDILDFSEIEIISNLMRERMVAEHPESALYLDFIDETWLNRLVIGHQGIIVVLERTSQLLPDFFPTLTVVLPYDELGSALLIRSEPPLASAPTTPPPVQTTPPDTDDPDDPDDPDDTPSGVPPQGTVDPSGRMIALTFDDGPGIYTNDFLDLFEQYGIRATFCTIGNLVNTQSEALARAVRMGSEVIGHSWDHKNLAKLNADDVRKQLIDTRDVIASATRADAVLKFRPPYGAVSDTMRDVAKELEMTIIYWTVDPEDWNTKDSNLVYDNVMAAVRDGSIILSHEIYKSTLEAYRRIIPDLLSQGYQFVTVSELLEHLHGELTPGQVYPHIS